MRHVISSHVLDIIKVQQTGIELQATTVSSIGGKYLPRDYDVASCSKSDVARGTRTLVAALDDEDKPPKLADSNEAMSIEHHELCNHRLRHASDGIKSKLILIPSVLC